MGGFFYGDSYNDFPHSFFEGFRKLEKRIQELRLGLLECRGELPTVPYLELRMRDRNLEFWEKSDFALQVVGVKIHESELNYYLDSIAKEINFLNRVDIDAREAMIVTSYYEIRQHQTKYNIDEYCNNFALIFVLLRDPELCERIPGLILYIKKALVVLCMQRIGIKNRDYQVVGQESIKGFIYRLLTRPDADKILDSIDHVLDRLVKKANLEIYEEFITTIEEVKNELGISKI